MILINFIFYYFMFDKINKILDEMFMSKNDPNKAALSM